MLIQGYWLCPWLLIYQLMYHHYHFPRKLVEIQAHYSLFEKRQCDYPRFLWESSANLSGCEVVKRRNTQIFCFFSFLRFARDAVGDKKPREGEWKESRTVWLCLTRRVLSSSHSQISDQAHGTSWEPGTVGILVIILMAHSRRSSLLPTLQMRKLWHREVREALNFTQPPMAEPVFDLDSWFQNLSLPLLCCAAQVVSYNKKTF